MAPSATVSRARGARRQGIMATAGTPGGAALDLDYLRLAFSGDIPPGVAAKRFGIATSTMSEVLNGRRVPKHQHVARMAKVAKVSADDVWVIAEAAIQRRIAAEKAIAADRAAEGGAP